MKNKTRRVEFISFYNHTGLEKHFTKMAKKGWLIECISSYYWTYRRIEPKDIHFCVTYYPRASDFDPEPSEEQQTFHDFCAHTGWKLCCTWHQMQVFYNEKEKPIPLETDPVMEVETLHKACKKNFLPSYFFLLALGLVMGGYFWVRLLADPIGLLSSASQLLTGFSFFCIAAISITELAAYYSWYRRARKAAQDGFFVDTPSTAKFQLGIMLLELIGLVLWLMNLAFAADPIYLRVAVLMLVYVVVLNIAVNGIKQGLKKAKASRNVNRFFTVFACFALSFALMGGTVWLTLAAIKADPPEKNPGNYAQIPISLADLIAVDEDAYITEDRLNQTVLLSQRVIYQRPGFDAENRSGMPDLGYTVTTINVPFLYNWCKSQLFKTSAKGYGGTYTIAYQETDAAPWGAVEAYCQLDEFGEKTRSYLLCYPKRIVRIHFDWDPTAEQMATVGQKLDS